MYINSRIFSSSRLCLFLIFALISAVAVAQPTTGNITSNFSSPNGTTKTFSHTQDAGDDRLLIVITQNPNGTNPTGVTYNGVSMTSALNWNNGIGFRNRIWYLEDPAEGSNSVVVTYSGGQWNKSAHVAISFTNSSGIGDLDKNNSGGYNTERGVTLTVEENSKIIAFGTSSGGTGSYIRLPDPTDLARDWNASLCCGKGSYGAVSDAFSAGDQTMTSKDANGWVYPVALEIKGAGASAPTITTTNAASSITSCSATSGAATISDGGASITAKGVCWSTSSSPTTSDNTTNDGSGDADFSSSSLTGLAANTTYYVRAYATNSEGTSYGPEISFVTLNSLPTISGSTPASRCGTGTVGLAATASSGDVKWYAASSGGASLYTGTSYTTPSISVTTTYYAEADDGTCTSAARTAVTATVNSQPTITGSTDGTRAGVGTVDLSATTSAGNVKWYAASSGGSTLATTSSGATWTTGSLSSTTVYYVEADDGTCTSASRTAVTANVLYPPGGVSTNLKLWLKADAGTSSSTDAADVNTWTDQSTNAYSASGYVAGGKYYENGINFNPTITFDGANDYYTISGGIIGSGVNIDDAFVYYVGTFDTDNTQMAVFHESCNDAANGGESSYWKFQREADAEIWYGKGRASSSYSLVKDDWGGVASQPYLWTAAAASSTATPQGTNKYITRNDNLIEANNGTSNAEGNGGDFYIGSNNSGAHDFDGNISELIIYEGVSSASDEDKIQSYLALKYGISMGTTSSTFSYLSSDGTTIWTGNATFQNDVAGIGRDDLSGLHQKQSKSVNYGAILTMSTQAIAADNDANTTSLNDGEFLMWGNNNASTSSYADLPTGGGYTGRLQKEWLIDMTGTVADVHVEFDLSDLHLNLAGDEASDFYLLTDADGDFTSGATATVATSFSGNKVTFDDFNFSDGQYFTLATKQSAPGGIASGLHLWYNASTQSHNTGTTQATDGQDVNNWHDQSGNDFDANSNQGDASYHENGMNFNPTLTFDGTGENYTVSGGIIGDDDTLHNLFVYFAGTVASTGAGRTVFNENTLNHTDDTHEIFMNRSSTANLTLDKGRHTAGTGRVVGTFGETVDQPHIVSACAGETTSTPQGTNKYITRDNTVVDTQDGTSNAEGNGDDFYLGSNDANGNDWHGNMSELIILNTIPTAAEEDQIQSYLAVKYGVTLASMDYLSSSGTVIWDNSTYSSYHYDIAGIGRDDLSGLHQKQSKSVNSNAIVTMSTEAIAANNAGISTALTDGAYLLWGNNNASTTAGDDLPAAYTGRLDKEWVVEMTGTVADVHIEFDISDLGLGGDAASDFYLLIDADGDFSASVTSETVASSFSSNKVTFNDIDFTDGQYFTLATKQGGPGGVSSNLLLWLKADAQAHNSGTTLATDGQDVDNWHDQSGNNLDAATPGTSPHWDADGINGMPALDFNDAEDNYMSISGGIFNSETKSEIFVYSVATVDDQTITNNLFSEALSGSQNHFATYLDWSDNWLIWDYGVYVDDEGRIQDNTGLTAGEPYVYAFASSTTTSTPNGTKKYMMRNNTVMDFGDPSTNNTGGAGAGNDLFIGSYTATGNNMDGLIGEFIVFDGAPTADEEDQIQTYLALKYGITMASMDYKNSEGTEIWDKDVNASYNNDISGIGRDDLSGLNQKQSKSINSDAIVTMSTQAIAANNAANTTQLGTDVSFEMWANNGGSVAMQTSELHSDFTERLGREWLVQENGTVGNVVVEVDLTGVSFSNTHVKNFALVIDDDGTFTGGTQSWVAASTYASDKVTFDAVDFSDGKYFTIMNTPNALPVELTYFEGKRIGSHVLLEWETMAEVNNDYFIVQKSYDGENWEEILTVDGQGNSSEPTYYSQIDIDGCEGVCYYKLIQVDFGGESKEEKIVAINSGGNNTEFKISVSPNPINQIANIAFSAPEGGMFNLTVTNQAGQVMYTAKTIGDKGNNHIAYNASKLSKGSYYFILEDENGNRTQQLVIK